VTIKTLKSPPTCFDHYSDHLQGVRKFLVKVTEFKMEKCKKSTAVMLQHHHSWLFTFFHFKFSDFNKELTNSLKMI